MTDAGTASGAAMVPAGADVEVCATSHTETGLESATARAPV
jgi:hypothetical protein